MQAMLRRQELAGKHGELPLRGRLAAHGSSRAKMTALHRRGPSVILTPCPHLLVREMFEGMMRESPTVQCRLQGAVWWQRAARRRCRAAPVAKLVAQGLWRRSRVPLECLMTA